jgi:hypothetical protein
MHKVTLALVIGCSVALTLTCAGRPLHQVEAHRAVRGDGALALAFALWVLRKNLKALLGSQTGLPDGLACA